MVRRRKIENICTRCKNKMPYYLVQYIDCNRDHTSSGYFKLFKTLNDAVMCAVLEYNEFHIHEQEHCLKDKEKCILNKSIQKQIKHTLKRFENYDDILFPPDDCCHCENGDFDGFRIVHVDLFKMEAQP